MKRIICILLAVCTLLSLAACRQADAPSAESTDAASQAEGNGQIPETAEPGVPTEGADPSLATFRQAMVETPQLFAAAYFGYASRDADPFAVMEEAAPQLCEDLPFLLTIGEEAVVGTFGYLFCIVPADENATVSVNRRPWNPQNESYDEPKVLYRSENGAPILVMCPNEDWIPDTEITITASNGTVAVWSPALDPGYHLYALRDANGENMIFDFTAYDVLFDADPNRGIDSSALTGTWNLAWTEVEGERNDVEPGVCTIEIGTDETGVFRFTYANRDFPEENVQDRELVVVPGELHPGCSNDRWIAEVTEESGDTVQYALTLLEDSTLLLQTFWEMDSAPWVSYGWYQRID